MAACSQPPLPGDTGTAVPAYAAIAMTGDSIRLADRKGHPLLLNVWATWCGPCKKEIPELQALHQTYSGSGLEVIGVSIDESGSMDDVAAFTHDYGMTYTIALDPDDHVSTAFRFQGVPASVLIDRAGIVRWRHVGAFQVVDPEFQAALKKVLAPTG